MKKLLLLCVLLALYMFAAPVLAQPPPIVLTKTCATPIVKVGEDAIFDVTFINHAGEDMYVRFTEALTGSHCPESGDVRINEGLSLLCQAIVPLTVGGSTVDNTIEAAATTISGIEYEQSASASCQIYGVMSGSTWNDPNHNGVWEGAESPMSGWKIHFFMADPGGFYTFDREVITDPDGSYTNDMVVPGIQYAVCEVLEPTYVQAYPNVMAAGYVDCTQFGSGYGPIGYDIIMSSGEYDTNNNFGNWVLTEGCGYTWGYWKNHNVYSKKDEGTWDKVPPGAEDSQFFDNWADPPVNSDALTWYEILKIPPKKSNAYVILSDQYVAAWLNIQKDVDPANPAVLGTAMADAESLLTFYSNGNNDPQNPSYIMSMYPPTIPRGANHFTSDDLAWAMELASMLDQFNRGALAGGPVYCGDKITLF